MTMVFTDSDVTVTITFPGIAPLSFTSPNPSSGTALTLDF